MRQVEVRLEVIEWLDDEQPGFVRCRLIDRHGRPWFFEEKVPIVSAADIQASNLPLVEWIAATATSPLSGSGYVTVRLAHGIEANDGTTTFEMPINSVRDPK